MEPAGVDSSTNGSMDPNWEMEHMARPTYFFFFFFAIDGMHYGRGWNGACEWYGVLKS